MQLIIALWILATFASSYKFIPAFCIAQTCVFFKCSIQLVLVFYWLPHYLMSKIVGSVYFICLFILCS